MRHRGLTLALATLLLLAAAFLRLHRLSEIPPGIANDESQNHADAIRVSLYGWFPAYDDTRPEPLNRYTQGALMAVGGRTVLTGRLAIAFQGILSVGLAFRAIMSLLYAHSHRRVAALFGMGVMAVLVNPIVLSRFGERGTLLALVMAAALHFLALGWRRNTRWLFVLAGFFGAGTIHTYTAGIFFPPAVVGVLLHQALFNFGAFRARVARLPYLLLGALPPLAWWVWQFSLPGPLYWRVSAVGLGRGNLLDSLPTLPRRWLATTQGLFRLGDCDPQFNVWSKPLLNPLLAVLLLAGVLIALRHFRRFESGLLLAALAAMLLPVALSEDIVHGMRIAGEFVVAAALVGWAVAAIWRWADQRFRSARWARPALALASSGLLLGTAVDSYVSYFSYLTFDDPASLICEGSPMNPEYYFLTEQVRFGEYLNDVQEPTYVPFSLIQTSYIYSVIAQEFPRVRSFLGLGDPGERLDLPDGQIATLYPDEPEATYALLLPGDLPDGRGQIILLPGLPPEVHTALTRQLAEEARPLAGPDGEIAAYTLDLSAASNPFDGFRTPQPELIATYDNGLELVGVDMPFVLQPGQITGLTLYWRKGKGLNSDDYTGVSLIDSTGTAYASDYQWTLRWLYAPPTWRPGEVVPDPHAVRLPDDLPPGVYRLTPTVTDQFQGFASPAPMRAAGPNGEPLGEYFPVGYAKVPLPEPPPMPPDAIQTDIAIGGARLRGYTVERNGERITLGQTRPGDTLAITFYWQVDERLPGLYHLFIHVQPSAEGEVLASFDGPPLGDHYPTIVWGPDERLVTTHTLTVPDMAGLEFRVGLYEWPTLIRLPVLQDGRRVLDDRAVLWAGDSE